MRCWILTSLDPRLWTQGQDEHLPSHVLPCNHGIHILQAYFGKRYGIITLGIQIPIIHIIPYSFPNLPMARISGQSRHSSSLLPLLGLWHCWAAHLGPSFPAKMCWSRANWKLRMTTSLAQSCPPNCSLILDDSRRLKKIASSFVHASLKSLIFSHECLIPNDHIPQKIFNNIQQIIMRLIISPNPSWIFLIHSFQIKQSSTSPPA